MAERQNILVVDDDTEFHAVIRWMLDQRGFDSTCVKRFDPNASPPVTADAILLDWELEDGKSGFDLLPQIRNALPSTPVIMLTSHSTTELAVEAMRLGAFDFITKPVDEGRLLASLTKAIEHGRLLRLLGPSGEWIEEGVGFEGIIGRSSQMRTIFRIIQQVAPTQVSVMVYGESGTGKELVARAIHQKSSRSNGPLVALNMAALPKELAESTLFGHEKGSFTGADRQRAGACGEAQGGTLFLDELCEMPMDLQAKLLRFLQERVYRRVGGDKDLTADVRIISATNRDPASAVREGRLRTDLYYRLNVVPIFLPALRDRPDDIPLLASHALKVFSQRYHKAFNHIDAQAIKWMMQQEWLGNVRQLYHMIERAAVLHDGDTLTLPMLPIDPLIRDTTIPANAQSPLPRISNGSTLGPVDESPVMPNQAAPWLRPDETRADVNMASTEVVEWPIHSPVITMSELERRAIAHALRVFNGSPAKAAKALDISEATIYRKIKTYHLAE